MIGDGDIKDAIELVRRVEELRPDREPLVVLLALLLIELYEMGD